MELLVSNLTINVCSFDKLMLDSGLRKKAPRFHCKSLNQITTTLKIIAFYSAFFFLKNINDHIFLPQFPTSPTQENPPLWQKFWAQQNPHSFLCAVCNPCVSAVFFWKSFSIFRGKTKISVEDQRCRLQISPLLQSVCWPMKKSSSRSQTRYVDLVG